MEEDLIFKIYKLWRNIPFRTNIRNIKYIKTELERYGNKYFSYLRIILRKALEDNSFEDSDDTLLKITELIDSQEKGNLSIAGNLLLTLKIKTKN